MAIRGVEKKQQMKRHSMFRDTRPFFIQILDDLRTPEAVLFIYGGLAAMVFALPALFETILFLGVILYLLMAKTVINIPFRKRMSLHEIDPNDLHPGHGRPMKGRGIGFLGNQMDDDSEIWVANEDLRTHMFIIGSTGAGKTEALLSLAYNPLVWGSGVTYADGKGDVSFWGKFFGLARSFGREDDVLSINYMTAGADTTKRSWDKKSNSYNPYQISNSESLTQLTTSLMDASGSGGDMWKGRAISFLTSAITPLCDLRDLGLLMLHIGVIRDHMPFNRYIELMENEHISERSKNMMAAFLSDVPGYQSSKAPDKQSPTFLEQYGYQQMQFTRIMSSLTDTYGHIYAAKQAEVNLKDVAINCRMLAVLLPALEKSRPELGNLGKIVVAGMKNMMGSQLGGQIQGSRRELIESRATNSNSPYLMIFDEFGYFMPEDSALMWAQARSLGFALVAAGQDIQAFYRTSKEETLAIFSNSNIKVLGKLEDPTDTFDLFAKHAAEAYVTEMDGYEVKSGSLMGDYKASQTAKVNKVSRLDMLDLKDQIEGQVHIFVRSEIIRARMFYADPITPNQLMPNFFIETLAPTEEQVAALKVDVGAFMAELIALQSNPPVIDDDLALFSNIKDHAYYQECQAQRKGAEAGIALFVMLHNPQEYTTNLPGEESNHGSNELERPAPLLADNLASKADEGEPQELAVQDEIEIEQSVFEQSVNNSAVVDPVTLQMVAAAAPILNSLFNKKLLFDTAKEEAEIMAGLATLSEESGFDRNDAAAPINALANALDSRTPEPDRESGKDLMDNAMGALESLLMNSGAVDE